MRPVADLRKLEKRPVLGRAPDARQSPDLGSLRPGDGTEQTFTRVVTAVAWFAADEFASAVARWPWLKERWGASSYEEYSRALQGHLLNFAASGMKPQLAPIRVEAYVDWCTLKELDPAAQKNRAAYAADLARRGEIVPWPPGRNDPCWCGSGKKYKRCCATAAPAPLNDETEL